MENSAPIQNLHLCLYHLYYCCFFPSSSVFYLLILIFFFFLVVSHNPHLFFSVFKVMYIKVTCLLKVLSPLGIKTMQECLF